MMRVFETHLVSNLTHGLGSIGKTFFDLIDNGKCFCPPDISLG